MPEPLQNLRTANRTASFQESVIREMTRLGDETGAINLSQGLPDFPSPPEILDAAVAAVRMGDNQYSFPFGTPELRQAVAHKMAHYNHIQADPEVGVTITCGVSEAIMSSILALSEPGDEVIILEPWYENYLPGCLMAGVKPVFVALHPPEYRFDEAALSRAITSRTRLILVNTPHNPTGRVFERSELEVIASLCQAHGVIAVTDEIYEHILYDGRRHTSLGSLPGMEDRTVTISGLGKTYAVTGWRVGWAAAHPTLTALIRKVHDYLTICAPTPFQAGGVAALALPDSYYVSLRAEYGQRRAILEPALRECGFRFRPTEGAYYITADFSRISWPKDGYTKSAWTDDRAFAEFLARVVGVAGVPGSSFFHDNSAGSHLLRFNFAKQPGTLHEAARRLQRLAQK